MFLVEKLPQLSRTIIASINCGEMKGNFSFEKSVSCELNLSFYIVSILPFLRWLQCIKYFVYIINELDSTPMMEIHLLAEEIWFICSTS